MCVGHQAAEFMAYGIRRLPGPNQGVQSERVDCTEGLQGGWARTSHATKTESDPHHARSSGGRPARQPGEGLVAVGLRACAEHRGMISAEGNWSPHVRVSQV